MKRSALFLSLSLLMPACGFVAEHDGDTFDDGGDEMGGTDGEDDDGADGDGGGAGGGAGGDDGAGDDGARDDGGDDGGAGGDGGGDDGGADDGGSDDGGADGGDDGGSDDGGADGGDDGGADDGGADGGDDGGADDGGADGGDDGGADDGGADGGVACMPQELELIAGQMYEAGWITASVTGEGLLFEIDASDPWLLQAVHVYAGVAAPGSNPGSYPMQLDLDYDVFAEVIVPFEVMGAGCGETVQVAVHADVTKPLGDGTCQQETAWGEHDFDFEAGWGGWVEITLCCD